MAIELVRRRICDIHRVPEGVKRYRLSKTEDDPRSVTLDLCPECAAPVEELMAAKPKPRQRTHRVTPVSEIKKRSTKKKS